MHNIVIYWKGLVHGEFRHRPDIVVVGKASTLIVHAWGQTLLYLLGLICCSYMHWAKNGVLVEASSWIVYARG